MNIKRVARLILSFSFIMLISTNASVKASDREIIQGKYKLVTEVFDYGQQVSKIVIYSPTSISRSSLNKNTFSIIVENKLNGRSLGKFTREINYIYTSHSSLGKPTGSGQYIIIELKNDPAISEAYTLFWDSDKFSNCLVEPKYTIKQNLPLKDMDGNKLYARNFKLKMNGIINLLVDDFKKATSRSGLNYRYFEPEKDDKKNPLIIWLHGVGEGGTNNVSQIAGNRGGVAFITEDIQKKFGGAYVIAPQCPTFWMKNFSSGDIKISGAKDYTQDLISLIKEYITNTPDIDTTRIYIGGCSMGGYQTLKTVIAAPELFAGAFPVCPAYTPTAYELDKLSNLPIWFTHSIIDPIVPYTNSKDAYEYLKQINDNAHYSEYGTIIYNGNPYSHHASWVYVLNNFPINKQGEQIFDWLSKQVNENNYGF